MQNHRPPSFFLTSATTLHHALCLGLIVPDSRISCRWFQTSSISSGEIHLKRYLKGVSSATLIMCSVEWVQPNSVGSNENTSWYLARSQWVASMSPRCQESNPYKSSSLNSFPCLCPDSQFQGMRVLGLITPLMQLSLPGWFRHQVCHYCPGHWGFLLEDL